jgi:light-regulated signal transduction histidine kinase (bacteriophytochrome)
VDGADALKALNLLIHDLRAPLSVAQGYLRLLQQNRLESEADRQRAMTQAMEALGRIGRICEDASAFIAEETAEALPISVAQVSSLMGQVREACTARCSDSIIFSEDAKALNGIVRAKQIDRLVQSLAVILCAVRRASRNASTSVSMHETENEARFLLGCDDDRVALMSQPQEAFDPWRGGHGIALPLACRVITEAGGRIWTCATARGAVGIALPVEAPVP